MNINQFNKKTNARVCDKCNIVQNAEKCDNCGNETRRVEKNEVIITEYENNQCGHCRDYIDDNDRFCRYCGTEKGHGEFYPYVRIVRRVPPQPSDSFECEKCGYNFWCLVKSCISLKSVLFCPQCGCFGVKSSSYAKLMKKISEEHFDYFRTPNTSDLGEE